MMKHILNKMQSRFVILVKSCYNVIANFISESKNGHILPISRRKYAKATHAYQSFRLVLFFPLKSHGFMSGKKTRQEEWTAKYRSWRNFVFESYNNRLNEMLHTIDTIAFMNMDERLVSYLREKARVNDESIIRNTHQEIAYDLHSSRVVISRLLKKLEQMGKIEIHRNYLKILEL